MLINEDIREKEVRLIGEDGEQLGIVASATALKMAYDRGLDLVGNQGVGTNVSQPESGSAAALAPCPPWSH